MKLNLVKIDRIDADESLFIRDGYNSDAIERYKEIYRAGGNLPPLKVQTKKDKQKLKLWEGFHRLKARKELIEESDRATIENLDLHMVDVEQYKEEELPDEDLLIAAVKANAEFGVPLTRRERNRLILRLRAQGKTLQEIADAVGLSEGRISQILISLGTKDTNNEEKPEEEPDQRKKIKKVNEKEIIEACLIGEKTQEQISEPYGINQSSVSRIYTDFRNRVVDKYCKGFTKLGIDETEDATVTIEQIEGILVDYGKLRKDLIGLNRIIQGDSFIIGKDIPDNSMDLVVTDIPYNISGGEKVMKRDGEIIGADIADWDYYTPEEYEKEVTDLLLEIKRILTPSGSFYIFVDKAYTSIMWYLAKKLGLHPKNIVHWRKTNPTPNVRKVNYTSTIEHIFFGVVGDGYTFNFTLDPEMHNVYDCAVAGGPDRKKFPHPAAKPIKLIQHLVEISSNPGNIVWDGFAGRGTTAIACIRTGRQWYMIEKEKTYVKIIKEWVSEEVKLHG